MISNKRGLSAIVGTLLIILLVIVAVGIVWTVLRGTLESGAGDIGLSTACLDVSVKPIIGSTCANSGLVPGTDACKVTYKRDAQGGDIAGIKVVYSSATTSVTHDIAGNIEPLATKTNQTIETGFTLGTTEKVEIVAYLKDSEGADYICETTNAFNL